MPDTLEWLGIFNSALLTTVDNWRYEQINAGDLTIEETTAKCQEILDLFWATSECVTCLLPNGSHIIRVGEAGVVEELIDGEWQTPQGDYTPPTITAREGGTADDQKCLAAKNAMNALKLLYENLTDSYGESLTSAEALSEFLLAIAAILAAAIAAWVLAIIVIVRIVWEIIYDTLEFVTMDLWTADFDNALTCILLSCANNTAGVVTFDYDCVINHLAAQTDPLGDLTASQLRLFGQLLYMLSFIGADGLNYAGTTTAISDDDCSMCDARWCYGWDFLIENGTADGWVNEVECGTTVGSYSGGWITDNGMYIPDACTEFAPYWARLNLNIMFGGSFTVEGIGLHFDMTVGGGFKQVQLQYWNGSAWTVLETGNPSVNQADALFAWAGIQAMSGLRVTFWASDSNPAGFARLRDIALEGVGELSPWGESNCEP